MPAYFDRIAAVEFPARRILEELKRGFETLKDNPVNLADDKSDWLVDPAWVATAPADASDVLQLLIAQRDAAIGVIENLQTATQFQVKGFQVAMARIRKLEACRQNEAEGSSSEELIANIAGLTNRNAELEAELAEANQTIADLACRSIKRVAVDV